MNNLNMSGPPPGHFIREELEAREWTQRDLAFVLGVPEQAVNLIVSGKRGISADMAKALAKAFDVPAEFFANLQKTYDLGRAREPDPGIERKARLQHVYPIREMIRRGWLSDAGADMLDIQMARFFCVSNANEIPHLPHAAKKASYDEVTPTQLAWLFRVKQIAREMVTPKYSEKALTGALAQLRHFMVDPEEIRHVSRLLGECGVRYVIVESLPNAKIDGACFWIDKQTPVIGMSLRHDRIDNYWFVLRHEIEHVLRRHGQTHDIVDVDIEGAATDVPDEERQANEAGSEFCVPRNELESFVARKAPFFSEKDLLGFARRIQVHPGIVAGQLRRRLDRWDLFTRLLVKIRTPATAGAVVDGWGATAPVTM
jgi:HTH-type transcriptional regulator/antitoxin HigA